MTAGRACTPSEGLIYLFFEGEDSKGYSGKMAIFNLAWLTDGKDWEEFLSEE